MGEGLISFLLLFSVIGNIKKGVSEEPCFKYVKCEPKNQCGCGIENKKVTYNRTKLNSRIVNGETVAGHIYPWMARMQITTVLAVQGSHTKNKISSNGAGAIITDRAIITAGHVLCKDEINADTSRGGRFAITCPQRTLTMTEEEWIQARGANLNLENYNEITFEVGNALFRPSIITPLYNKDVFAYVYNYDANKDLFSSNGDVGLLIIKTKIGLNQFMNWLPICSLYGKHLANDVKVKLAGWGRKYWQYTNTAGELKTSCATNQGRGSININSAPRFDQRYRFLDCNIASNQQQFCYKWIRGINTMSASTDLANIQNLYNSDDERYLALKENQNTRMCENYMKKALAAWRSQGKDRKEFDETVDRIRIKKFGETTIRPENICYNMAKVARHGFCLTSEPQPRDWGFCSRSCEYLPAPAQDDSRDFVDKPYDVGMFQYFENNPLPDKTLQSFFPFWVGDLLQAVHKCISPILPNAKNAVFHEINQNRVLEWRENIYDASRPERESGHLISNRGDSGSPYWMTETINGKPINTLIAVHSIKLNRIPGSHTNDLEHKCTQIATKITPEMMNWAYSLSSIFDS